MTSIGANVSEKTISRHFEIYTKKSGIPVYFKDSGKILKVAREHIGNEKVVKLPTLFKQLEETFLIYFAKNRKIKYNKKNG